MTSNDPYQQGLIIALHINKFFEENNIPEQEAYFAVAHLMNVMELDNKILLDKIRQEVYERSSFVADTDPSGPLN